MHLAQVNGARLLAPLESARLAGFVAALGPINALADEALGRLGHLRRHGPGPQAFTFAQPYPAPGAADAPPTGRDWLCPA